jgi:hypothetical protein
MSSMVLFVDVLYTVTSLVEFSNFVLSEMAGGLQVDAVYIGILKAFDRVNHGLLLGTLTRKFRLFSDRSYTTGKGWRLFV